MSWNFALILFVLLIVTGIVWFIDLLSLRPGRRQRMEAAAAEFDRERAPQLRQLEGEEAVARQREQAIREAGRVPWWVEYSVSFFPVILFVFALRSFVVEPFRIPSGSMLPTLEAGDLILVNKYNYGVRLPIINTKVIEVGEPQRGDVMVFHYPPEPEIDFIKRVIGLPGDEIVYADKRLFVNGTEVPRERVGEYFEPDRASYTNEYNERLGEIDHRILIDPRARGDMFPNGNFPNRNNCQYGGAALRCVVPEGHYFVMGDNRDNSADSRFWGFVPEDHIVDKAFMVWMNFGNLGRIGKIR